MRPIMKNFEETMGVAFRLEFDADQNAFVWRALHDVLEHPVKASPSTIPAPTAASTPCQRVDGRKIRTVA